MLLFCFNVFEMLSFNIFVFGQNFQEVILYEEDINTDDIYVSNIINNYYFYCGNGNKKEFFKKIQNIFMKKNNNYDEVKSYSSGRYIGSTEAAWRLFSFPLNKISKTIIRLPIHLENNQNVFIDHNNPDVEIDEINKQTQLTEWFVLNQNDPSARNYYYFEIPKYYVFNAMSKKWQTRKKGMDKIIVRIHNVNYKNRELYCMRMLLFHVKGALSFRDLRTFDDIVYNTYEDACRARGLLNDQQQFENTLQEAITYQMPNQIRYLFVMMCVSENRINNRELLWEKSKNELSEDFINYNIVEKNSLSDDEKERCHRKGLREIERLMRKMNINPIDYIDIPMEEDNDSEEDFIDDALLKGFDYIENKRNQLNEDQKRIFDHVGFLINKNYTRDFNISDFDNNESKLVFINGFGGTGKQFLFQCLIDLFNFYAKTYGIYAMTGIAASLLNGGRTIHSGFGIPLNTNEFSHSNIELNSNEAYSLKHLDVIIIDEISMLPKNCLNIVNNFLKELTDSNEPFGGKIVLIAGDFRQILPVVEGGNMTEIINNCVKKSIIWREFYEMKLQFTKISLNTKLSLNRKKMIY